ncbi:LUD domain-containing protein [Halalkalicoccus sp. NIPERK01]|uniref:LUD domain-containing protein n=1 Tax=Halalkalicoccus sp. NIPERK01 TaxID=3053469 RepID=UPI00256F249F|nr:LUD domain-containing protein [Halalkalicoccus sp. NIPERK01]MDL5360758.1 LUD domain-containing protein [Halalkalicoccus sp. NIPERK01]
MSIVDTFEGTLDGLAVETTRLAPEAFEDALEAVVDEPAVGTPLPMASVSLEGTSVVTDPTPRRLTEAVTGVTAASLGIADYGSVVLPSTPEGGEPVSLFCDHHVVVIDAADIVPDMPTAIGRMATTLADERESAIIATGPSATADMGALVRGAHGPKTVHVLVLEP